MSFHQGQGGAVVANGNTLSIRTWEMTKKRDAAEVTHSGSGGWRNRVATLKDANGKFTMAWNDTQTPESKGFDIGAGISLVMGLGDSGLSYTASAVLIQDLMFKNDNSQGCVELEVTWVGNGAVTGPA